MIRLSYQWTLFILLIISNGCTTYPKLKISDVGIGKVDLFLDENKDLDLSKCFLEVSDGHAYKNQINLLDTILQATLPDPPVQPQSEIGIKVFPQSKKVLVAI